MYADANADITIDIFYCTNKEIIWYLFDDSGLRLRGRPKLLFFLNCLRNPMKLKKIRCVKVPRLSIWHSSSHEM